MSVDYRGSSVYEIIMVLSTLCWGPLANGKIAGLHPGVLHLRPGCWEGDWASRGGLGEMYGGYRCIESRLGENSLL